VRPTVLATTRHGRDVKWLAERKHPDFPILTPFHHPRAKLLLSHSNRAERGLKPELREGWLV
jgi:hypothetical protein